MSNETYNGWTNYETWAANLWLDNDQGSQDFIREQAKDILESNQETDDDGNVVGFDHVSAVHEMACWLKDYHQEAMPEVTGVYADLLGAALGRVDWHEIAGHHIDAVIEEAEYERRQSQGGAT